MLAWGLLGAGIGQNLTIERREGENPIEYGGSFNGRYVEFVSDSADFGV